MIPAGQTAAEDMPGNCVTCGCLLEFPIPINNYLKLSCASLDVFCIQVPGPGCTECVLTPGLELYSIISSQELSFHTPFCRVVLPLPQSLGNQQLDGLFFFFWEADLTVVSYGILYMERNSKDIFSSVSSVSGLLMFAFFYLQEATVFWSLIVWAKCLLYTFNALSF